jgi:hypothetical protein
VDGYFIDEMNSTDTDLSLHNKIEFKTLNSTIWNHGICTLFMQVVMTNLPLFCSCMYKEFPRNQEYTFFCKWVNDPNWVAVAQTLDPKVSVRSYIFLTCGTMLLTTMRLSDTIKNQMFKRKLSVLYFCIECKVWKVIVRYPGKSCSKNMKKCTVIKRKNCTAR